MFKSGQKSVNWHGKANHLRSYLHRIALDAGIVHPREVFRPVIKRSIASIICVYIHPSGEDIKSPNI
ncbi:JAB domain-containing protein [Brevibacillus laterosporus]|uniref:JAB domain-containing protein n=1 Tax=Brevibacillus laterosporus TaxID=1465 RepID=UPI001F559E12|nr:JAB domain-containing protein [Brevibacillus laterosporus]